MKLQELSIPDVTYDNVDESKVKLANSVINSIYPKFETECSKKNEELENLKVELHDKKMEVNNKKEKLQELLTEFERRKRILKLVNRIERIISAGAASDGSIRHEMIVLLKVCENMNDDKLNRNLERTQKVLKKRYSES